MHHVLLTAVIVVASTLTGFSQKNKGEIPEVKYRRSSLHNILIQGGSYESSSTVEGAFTKAPFPDKYNRHKLDLNTLERSQYELTTEEREALGIKKTKGGEYAKSLGSIASGGIADMNSGEIPHEIDKFIADHNLGRLLVEQWYARDDQGMFHMDTIMKRGQYDASALDEEIASGAKRADAILSDAGEELIDKTFVIFHKLHFVENEKLAGPIKDAAIKAASAIPNALLSSAAIKAAEVTYNNTKDGYTVFTTSHLYKLNWNDTVAAIFYNTHWMYDTDSEEQKEAKKKAFEASDIFKLNYIGKAKASTVVIKGMFSRKSDTETIELATIRNVDDVYSKLQKKYDVFKVKTPIYSVGPITARIGMKEGLTGGEKFEVLEQVQDPETKKTTYKKKGVITVDKKLIWDNRQTEVPEKPKSEMTPEELESLIDRALLGEDVDPPAETTEEVNEAALLGATTFKGGSKKLYPGMLIRQLK